MEKQHNHHITSHAINQTFLEQLEKTAVGKRLLDCIQCGVCSGSCHARFAMDYSPMQIIKMTHLGLENDVLASSTIWICASCYTCTSRCPQGIDIPLLMSSLKNMAIDKKVPAKIPSKPKFHKAFTEIVGKHGRMNETELQLRLLDKTRPREVLRNARFGVQMWRKGKVKLSPSTIGRIKDLKAVFKSASKRGEGE